MQVHIRLIYLFYAICHAILLKQFLLQRVVFFPSCFTPAVFSSFVIISPPTFIPLAFPKPDVTEELFQVKWGLDGCGKGGAAPAYISSDFCSSYNLLRTQNKAQQRKSYGLLSPSSTHLLLPRKVSDRFFSGHSFAILAYLRSDWPQHSIETSNTILHCATLHCTKQHCSVHHFVALHLPEHQSTALPCNLRKSR